MADSREQLSGTNKLRPGCGGVSCCLCSNFSKLPSAGEAPLVLAVSLSQSGWPNGR